jgi:hypothetical protein
MMEKGGKIEVGDILILPKDMGITASGIKDKINNNKKIITTKWVVKEIYIDRYGADRIVINNSKEERTSYRDKVQMLNNYFKYGVQFKDGGMMADGGMMDNKSQNKQEWVAIYQNQERPNQQRVITAFGNTKEEAIRNARMSEGYYGLKSPYQLIEIYTYSGNLPMMDDGGMMADGGTTPTGGYDGLDNKLLSQKINIFLNKIAPYKFYYINKDDNTLYVGFDENVEQDVADKVYNAAISSREFFDADSVDMKYYPNTGNIMYSIKLKINVGYESGGLMEENEDVLDLFEDYENIPESVQNVLDEYSDAFENGGYEELGNALSEMRSIGYTFDYGLDGVAYNLRKITN